jgi:hypothetical protein
MFTSFLCALSFSFTQSPLIYAFRIMTCDEYYKTHEWAGQGDRCAVHRIEADTASAVALVGASTMSFSTSRDALASHTYEGFGTAQKESMCRLTRSAAIINVFVTGWWIKRFGVKAAMFQQTGWAAARNLCQIYAQTIGGQTGIAIIQVTQVFNVMGSGGGYQLAASAFIAVLAEPEARTALFGVQGGVQMLGAAAGYVCEWEPGDRFAVAQPICAILLVTC